MTTPKTYLEGQAISKVWRMRSSADEVVELKYLLENMQDASELLGRSGDFRVVWSGMENLPGFTDYGKKIVGMSYGFVKDEKFPLDPKLVDVLIGVLQHEMGHVRQGNVWSREPVTGHKRGRRVGRKVFEKVIQTREVYPAPVLTKYQKRADGILKDVNIDTAMIREHPLRGAYIMRGRQYFAAKPEFIKTMDMIITQTEPIDWMRLTILWSGLQIYYINTIIHRLTARPDFLALADVLGKLNELSIAAGQLAIDDPLDNEKLKKLVLEAGRLLHDYDRQQEDALAEKIRQQQQSPNMSNSAGSTGKGEQQNEGQKMASEDKGEGQGEDEDGQDGEQPPAPESEQGQADEQDGSENGEDSQEDGCEQNGGDGSDSGNNSDGQEGDTQQSGCLMSLDAGDVSMPQDLAEEVFKAVEQEVEDVTQKVMAGDYGNMIMRRPGADHERVTSIADGKVGELQESIDILTEIATQRTLGTEQGTLSESLLWKLGTGEDNVFERKNVISDVSLKLGLVVDGSSSINGQQWQIMLDTIDACIEAFGHRHDIDLLVFTYHAGVINRVWEPGFEQTCMLGVRPSGSTPTLPALKMMIERMDETCQDRQRTVILSITDGDPNTGGYEADVRTWVDSVQREHDGTLQIVGVGIGVSERKLEAQYDRWMTVDSFEELPAKLKELMLEILLEG